MKRLLPERELFWEKVDLFHNITDEDCWNWTGCSDKDGYGRFNTRPNGIKKMVAAHRYCWEIFKPKIPDGILLLHKCDWPPCVNPSHLFLGTHKDNVDDMISKERTNYAICCKLTLEQVLEIKTAPAYRGVNRDLSLKHGVSDSVISEIRSGKLWADLNPKHFERYRMSATPEPNNL